MIAPVAFLAVWGGSFDSARGDTLIDNSFLSLGTAPRSISSVESFARNVPEAQRAKEITASLCQNLSTLFSRRGWEKNPCGEVSWRVGGTTVKGHPLLYAVFGQGHETTMVLNAVHPDETSVIPMGFRLARHLQAHPEVYSKRDVQIVVAPLLNPDGLFLKVPTRTNANGIDLNRNFLTMDWYPRAKSYWRFQTKRDPRRFPGFFPNSEAETLFQIQLIEDYRPDKILSLHSPLGFLDYDGPGDHKPVPLKPLEREAKRFVYVISEKAKDLKVVDFMFYPGSLGNFAGNERGIPTVTVEFDSNLPGKADVYWNKFLPALIQGINYPYHNPALSNEGNASRFFGLQRPHEDATAGQVL
jgi:protein MpaA